MFKPTRKEQQVAFNLGAKQLEIVGMYLSKAAESYSNGNVSAWFFGLKTARLQISNITPENEEKIKKIEKIIAYLFSRLKSEKLDNPDVRKANAANNLKVKAILYQKIEEYDKLIKAILQEKGYLVPLKRDRTALFGQDMDDDEMFEDEENEEES